MRPAFHNRDDDVSLSISTSQAWAIVTIRIEFTARLGLHSQTTRLIDSASWCDKVQAQHGSHPLWFASADGFGRNLRSKTQWKPVNPARQLTDGGSLPFAAFIRSKSQNSLLLSIGLVIVVDALKKEIATFWAFKESQPRLHDLLHMLAPPAFLII
ncbi:hypothetical protein Fmac_020538 [Flemingia macrophylla]|uniref:Uncharacterized protein n=1 Tax=Flemingia macrophylla TaxID=520843 RepID=A0ABD1LUI4_9FABA